ncbi:MAG: heme-binding protein [Pseudomonadota bacterium]
MNLLAISGIALAGTATAVAGAWYWSSTSVEQPEYTTITRDGPFELRSYPELTLASIDAVGSRGSATRTSFSPLAEYIFAKQRGGEKIAMTAPVTQQPVGEGWTVSFIMPAGRTVDDLPAPTGDVRLETVPARTVAAVRFSGRWTDSVFGEQTEQLKRWMSSQRIQASDEPVFAYYNDPFTPAFLRRNEVLIEVEAGPGQTLTRQ